MSYSYAAFYYGCPYEDETYKLLHNTCSNYFTLTGGGGGGYRFLGFSKFL